MDDFRLAQVLIEIVARAGGVKVKQLRGRSTQATLCKLRDTARFLIRQRTKLSYSEIGKLFRGQDHSSVLVAVRREQMRLDRKLVHTASGMSWYSWHDHILALLDQEVIRLAGGPAAVVVQAEEVEIEVPVAEKDE